MLGVFTLNSSITEVFVLVLFGAVGYFMRRYGYPVAGATIAVILGSGLEANLRRGLLLTHKSWWEFLTRPWVAVIVGASLAFLIYATIGTIKLARKAALVRREGLAKHLAGASAPAKQPEG